MSASRNYDDRLEFEHDLINRRLTWLLTSQSILFAALAFVLGDEFIRFEGKDANLTGGILSRSEFFNILGSLGLMISLLIWVGVCMGILAKCTTWYDERMRQWNPDATRPWILTLLLKDVFSKRSSTGDEPHLGVRTGITIVALLPDFFMPLAFAWAWWRILSI